MPINLLANLLANLRFRSKFAVVFLLVVIGMGVLSALLVHDRNRTVAILEQETLGLQTWKPVIETIKFQQRSRGLSNAWLSGDDSAQGKMQAAMRDADAKLADTDAAARPLPEAAPALKNWRQAWDKVKQESGSASANLTRLHTDAITLGLAALQDMSNASALTFEQAEDSYYLQGVLYEDIPQAIELYGQFRALGTGINTAHELPPAQHAKLVVLESRINSQLQRLRRQLELLARAASPSLKATVLDYQQKVDERRLKVIALIQDLQQGKYSDPQAFFAEMTQVIDRAYAFSEEKLFVELANNIAARKAEAERQRLLTLLAAGTLFILILLLFAAIIRNVTQQVESVRHAAEALANGDLTQAPHTRGTDELSEAVRSLATGIDKLRGIFRDFSQAIATIDSQTSSLATASTQVAAASEHQAVTVSQLAATVEEMTAGVQHIADSTAAACQSADTTGQLASHGEEMTGQTVQGIGAIANHVEESAAIVQRLGNESAKISTIVGTIKEIADQTNLLALNAAIEAARAGESGRGFAVVADEVRKLAERTSGATVEISTNIGNIQSDIRTAVNAMEQSVENVQQGVGVAESSGEAMTQIQQQAVEVKQMVSDINLALQEQTTATEVVGQSIEALAQVSEQNHSAAESVRETTEQLRQQAQLLEQRMRAFRI